MTAPIYYFKGSKRLLPSIIDNLLASVECKDLKKFETYFSFALDSNISVRDVKTIYNFAKDKKCTEICRYIKDIMIVKFNICTLK